MSKIQFCAPSFRIALYFVNFFLEHQKTLFVPWHVGVHHFLILAHKLEAS